MSQNDRKRSFDAVGGSPSQPAKRPLQELSEDGPLTQEDVVYFKKEAIWRQMKSYKRQASELQREVSKYEKRYQAFLSVHFLLENWYKMVLSAHATNEDSESSIELSLSHEEIEVLLEKRRSTLSSLLKLPASSTMEETLSKLCDTLSLEAERDKAVELQNDLNSKISDLELQLDEALKANDRNKSKTLERISSDNHAKEEEPESSQNGTQNGTKPIEPETDNQAANAQRQELEQLKIEFAQLKAGNASLEERLSAALVDQQKAELSANAFTEKLQDLDETDLLKSRRYLELLEQKNALAELAAQSKAAKEDLIVKVRQSEEKEGNFVRSVSHELEEDNHRLKNLLTKAENDLVRIRTARDELLGKQTILKSEVDNKTTNEELMKLNVSLNDRLKDLEEQRRADDTSSPSLEQLEKSELIRRLGLLSEELKDIEKAFQSTRESNLAKLKEVVDREGLMKKLSIEKNKADQKYFASMRLKDSLVAENKVLKSQVAKSQELVTKLSELEKAYVSKIDLLTKSVDEYRVIKESSTQENTKLHETIKKLTKIREFAAKEISSLKEELSKAKKEIGDVAAKLGAHKTSESKLEAKLKATESLLSKYKQNNTSSILQEDEKQLEALRSITKCSVCSKNWKNTAITACGHVFCDGCVQERLAARLRRCPTCNKGFSSNDLLSIHL